MRVIGTVSSWPRCYTYGFAAGMFLGGGTVAVLAGLWFTGTNAISFVESHPQLQAGVNGAVVAALGITLILAWIDADEAGE